VIVPREDTITIPKRLNQFQALITASAAIVFALALFLLVRRLRRNAQK
jgi:hypothetical protein